uniref:Uncharacterized protein n=1 Tax=Glossina austeni TaxID=7395 RepID=A0A1A9VU30_GLOAU
MSFEEQHSDPFNMTVGSVIFLPSQTLKTISISDNNEDDLEIVLSTQSNGSGFDWTTISKPIFMEYSQMEQFLQSGAPDYGPRYESEARFNEVISYDHSFDIELLNINIPTAVNTLRQEVELTCRYSFQKSSRRSAPSTDAHTTSNKRSLLTDRL